MGTVTPQSIDKILKFLPIFEQEGYRFAQQESVNSQDGVIPFGTWTYADEVTEFQKALYEEGFIIQFDWTKWQDKAEELCSDRTALEKADLKTLQKLLTTHFRKERFCEGHLAQAFNEGHITAILNRLREIRRSHDG